MVVEKREGKDIILENSLEVNDLHCYMIDLE